MKVRATDEFMKRGIKPKELKRIPKAGTEFEIEESRFNLLAGDNKFNVVFVEKVEEIEEEEVETEKEEEKTKTTSKTKSKNKTEETPEENITEETEKSEEDK